MSVNTSEGLYKLALEASNKAAMAENARLPLEHLRGLDCGFAWVVIKPARGPFVAWLKANGIGSLFHSGGWSIWYSKLHNVPTQSISVHFAAVAAFAEVLRNHGIRASADQRLD